MRYHTRDFGDASFAYDATTGNSLFLEGPLASAALRCITTGQVTFPQHLLASYDIADHAAIRDDWHSIERAVHDFIGAPKANHTNVATGAQDTAFELLSQYAVKKWQIVNVNIELTHQCNQRCQWCCLEDFKPGGLPRSKLAKLAQELRSLNALFVLFTGGELFLRRDATAVMADFAEQGFVLEIKTNGSLLNEKIITELRTLPLLDVQVSIYETAEGWSRNTNSVYPVRNIERAIANMVNAGLPVTVSVLVGKHNIDSIQMIHKHLSTLGANVYYSPYLTPNRLGVGEELSFRLSRDEMEQKLAPFLLDIGGFSPQRRYRDCASGDAVCYAGRDQIAIDPNGAVYPCLDLRIPLGSVKQDSLMEVLERRKSAMERFSFKEILRCQHCSIRDFCDSCIGIALVENGDYRKPSHHKCDIIHFYARKEVRI